MKVRFFVLLIALFVLSACAQAATSVVSQNSIEVYAPVVTAAKTGEVTGAFMIIKNAGDTADWLVGAECDAAGMVQVHETKMDGDVMSMAEVASIAIPAGETLELRHGSYHIMLMDLKQDLTAGQTIMVTLKFLEAGEVAVPVIVTSK